MSTPWKVGAIGHQVVPWFLVLPDTSSVADLTRAVEARQNKLLQEDSGSPKIAVDIKLKVDGDLYAVDPDDLLLNLVPTYSKGPMFVAVRTGGGSANCGIHAAAGAAGAAARAAAEARAAVAAAAVAVTPRYGTSSTLSLQQLPLCSNGADARRGMTTSAARKPMLPSPAARATLVDSRKMPATANSNSGESNSRSNPCEACRRPLDTNRRPSFCCRTCHKLFHSVCAGYDPRKRQSPPPDWICPRCPNGERGPVERFVHPSLKKRGSVNQKRGNQQWCPICLDDNRVPGTGRLGSGSKRCTGCGFHAHAGCRTEMPPCGRWPCDECQRRRDGVVPSNNPAWLRLKAARLDGGFGGSRQVWSSGPSFPPSTVAVAGSPSLSKRAVSGAAVAPSAVTPPAVIPPAVSPPAATGPPSHLNQLTFSSRGSAAWSSEAKEAAVATAAVAAAAASFRPPQCLPSSGSSLASVSSPSTTVPSSPRPPALPPSPPLTERASAEGSPLMDSSPAIPAAAPTIKAEHEGRNDNWNDDNDDDEDVKPRRYPKRAKATSSDHSQTPGQPQFRHEFDWQPAENAVLAPIMLYGLPEQQHLARAFISTKFNKTTPEACDALVAKLKETVKLDDEGTWVHRLQLINVCSADDNIVRYLLGPNTQDSYRRVTNKFKILANFSSWPGSKSQLFTHAEDFDYSRYFILRK